MSGYTSDLGTAWREALDVGMFAKFPERRMDIVEELRKMAAAYPYPKQGENDMTVNPGRKTDIVDRLRNWKFVAASDSAVEELSSLLDETATEIEYLRLLVGAVSSGPSLADIRKSAEKLKEGLGELSRTFDG